MTQQQHTTPVVQPAWGRIDYLKCTVYEPANSIPVRIAPRATWRQVDTADLSGSAILAMDIAEDALLLDDGGFWGSWVDQGHGARGVKRRLQAVPGLTVLDFDREYSIVECQGAYCERVGNAGLASLLRALDARTERWGSSRVDMAWDGFPASVQTVRRCLNKGHFFSSLRPKTPVPFYQNEQGSTVYTGPRSAKRLMRWYDRRGPVRFEYELKGEYADAFAHDLSRLPVDEWPDRGMAAVVDAISFTDQARSGRKVFPWWSSFIKDTEGERLAVAPKDLAVTSAVQKMDGHFQRHTVVLCAAVEEFGVDYVLKRLSFWKGKRGITDEVNQLRQELSRARGSGLAGIPDPEQDLPI